MSQPVKIRRALLSVSDKTDLIPFARSLNALGVQIISTGGTARTLAEAGIPVVPIEQVTGFPEIMDGRVKTLHPSVHGAILARRDIPEHVAAMKAHGIEGIDLVCINLYPFERTVSQPGASMEDAIENIDVGGPAMMRAAAKNYHWVTACSAPKRYDQIVNELTANDGCTSLELRAELAAAAFGHTAEYDAAIASFLSRRSPQAFPQVLRLSYTRVDELRYGENPHQAAALYRDPASTGPTIVNSQQLHGKQLSFNNINDAAAALEVVKSLHGLVSANTSSICTATYGTPSSAAASPSQEFLLPGHIGACVVKHTNPCGAAVASSVVGAISAAIAGDPQAAYGGILAVNAEIDAVAARRIAVDETFFEVVIAPGYTDEALEILRKRWANVRILAVGRRAASRARKLDYRSVPGGMLVQDRDTRQSTPEQWEHRAGPAATPSQAAAAAFLETVCKYVASNSVVIGGQAPQTETGADAPPPLRLFGIGSGQVDRVTACRNAVAKAGTLCRNAVAVGDAFFPFSDGPALLADAGVKVIVHPGGSKRDQETFDLCAARGVTCLTTGVRHFRH